MDEIEKTVLDLHTELMKSRGIERESSPDLEIRPRNGITSESIVTFLIDIEEKLNCTLDDYLPQIRQCKTMATFIDVVKEAVSKSL